jgi:hypothetical protein
VKHGFFCGTRPWSTGGGRSELSHYALDDRHAGGAKSGARGAVRFSRVVPALLVSTRYTALLREEVGRTVWDPAEIHALCDALVASEGRLGP